jgi:hypothetical protein
MAKRKASQELEALEVAVAEPTAVVKITPLGAGQEVGRSCIILEYMCVCRGARRVVVVGWLCGCSDPVSVS